MSQNKQCSSCSKEPMGRINISRFINALDKCFETNDLDKAVETVEYWESEARACNDTNGLLSVLNEQLGLYRRINHREKGIRVIDEVLAMLSNDSTSGSLSRATIYINLATTMKAFGRADDGIGCYERAEEIFRSQNATGSYEYAALLNNKSSALEELNRFEEAEICLNSAIEILKTEGKHDADIALSYISLAHLNFDRDNTAYDTVEALLDTAWEYINSPRQAHDSDYAFAISKCVPSLRYFGRDIEADAIEETVEEIYGAKK